MKKKQYFKKYVQIFQKSYQYVKNTAANDLLDFLRKNVVISVFLVILIAGWIWYVITYASPYTNNAYVVANVRPVSAIVPGPITDIYVSNNQDVKKGDKLFMVYEKPYELRVAQAQSQVDMVAAQIDLQEAEIVQDKYLVEQKQAQYDYASYRARIERPLAEKEMTAQVVMRKLDTNVTETEAELKFAKAQLEVSKQMLKVLKNKLISMKTELADNKIKLEQTTVYAEADGTICNMFLSKGAVVETGEPLFAFVETDKWWVQANFSEKQIGNVRSGQKAKIVLSLYPHHTFHGVVDNIGWGVDRQKTSPVNALPVVEKENEWFLLPQRFPVQILITESHPKYPLHVGASCTVSVRSRVTTVK